MQTKSEAELKWITLGSAYNVQRMFQVWKSISQATVTANHVNTLSAFLRCMLSNVPLYESYQLHGQCDTTWAPWVRCYVQDRCVKKATRDTCAANTAPVCFKQTPQFPDWYAWTWSSNSQHWKASLKGRHPQGILPKISFSYTVIGGSEGSQSLPLCSV